MFLFKEVSWSKIEPNKKTAKAVWVCYGSVLPENWPPLPISQQPDMPSSGGGGRKHVEIVELLGATFNPLEFEVDPLSHQPWGAMPWIFVRHNV